jgi:hypothetical protein
MKIIASIMIIMALVVGLVPQFTDCASQGRALTLQNGKTVPMKCHWTGQAEIAIAGPLLIVGALMAFNRRKDVLRSLSILGIVLGVFVVLLPTALIGVCANPEMLCNSVMKPTLIFGGTLTSLGSMVGLALTMKGEPQTLASAGA